ncbi:MAG TPA: sulfocyanin-like copper-binding protein [Gemmatimonadales bacterium]|nr:sulfocyanin-like copper-binding protein [Gemmatimonadales bacterium]
MFTSLRRRDRALFLTGLLAGISAAGCSKAADRPPSTETAASTPADRTMADSSTRPADTTTAARTEPSVAPTAAPKPATKPSPTDTPPKPAPTPPLPKPNIDPGRKPPTKPADTSKAAPAGQDQWLKYDAGSNTVTFELIAGPFNFNGFTNGGATLTLPAKANVVMNFINKDGTPHSAEIISGEGPIPNAAVDPAIPRAYTNKVIEGLPQEASDVLRFTVSESGEYRIFCGVPGHGLSGMWFWMRVDPAAKTPSFGPTKT